MSWTRLRRSRRRAERESAQHWRGASLASDAPVGLSEAGELVAGLGRLLAHLLFGDVAEAAAQGLLRLLVQARGEQHLQDQVAALVRMLRAGLTQRVAQRRVDRAVAHQARDAIARRACLEARAAAMQG